MSSEGQKAGAALVKLRYEKMTAEQRSETARKAARARWGAKKKGGRKRQ